MLTSLDLMLLMLLVVLVMVVMVMDLWKLVMVVLQMCFHLRRCLKVYTCKCSYELEY